MRRLAVFLCLTLFLGMTFAASDSKEGTKPPVRGLKVIKGAPEAFPLLLTRLDGSEYDLKDDLGKVVIVNFWATWCMPCRQEMPAMNRLMEKTQGKGIKLIGVNVDEDEKAIQRFLEQVPVDFTILLDPGAETTQAWRVRGLPTTYVVDTKGRMRYRVLGGREWDEPEVIDFLLELQQETH